MDSTKTAAADGELVDVVRIAPDKQHVLSSASDALIKIWPVAGGEPRVLRTHSQIVYDAEWSPDGRTIASCSGDKQVIL